MSFTITLQRTTYTDNDSIHAAAFNAQSALGATIPDGQSYAFGLGTAGAPSVSFTADADTGLYSPGANQLALVTAGVERLTIGAAGLVTVGAALAVTGALTVGAAFTASGDLGVTGALTAASTVTVTGLLTASGALTVAGALTASGPLTVAGSLTASAGMIGAVTAPAGLVGTPSVAFAGDADTGIYSPGANQLALVTGGTTRLTIDAAGNVGIGTNPAATFDVGGTYGSMRAKYITAIGALAAYNSATGGLYFGYSGGGFIRSVADNSATAASLYLQVGNGLNAILITPARAVQFSAYGAGSLVSDSSGNITASSDARLKDVTGTFQRGLADVLKLQPKRFRWTAASGMNPDDENVGFVAQDVLAAIPEAVGQFRTVETEEEDPEHKGQKRMKRERRAVDLLTLSDRPIIAALVNAVKELAAQMATNRQYT